jgi:hypothetical protein
MKSHIRSLKNKLKPSVLVLSDLYLVDLFKSLLKTKPLVHQMVNSFKCHFLMSIFVLHLQ